MDRGATHSEQSLLEALDRLSEEERETLLSKVTGGDAATLSGVRAALAAGDIRTGGGLEVWQALEDELGLTSAPGELTGRRVGAVELRELLGVGGMGEVYRAVDPRLERSVAVKCLRADRSWSLEAKQRIRREAQILARLDHPEICRLYDLVEQDDRDYLILELVSGTTLDKVEDLPREQVLEIAEGILDALAAAHAEGVVHRDLKPGNLSILPSGKVKVLDFGIARSATEPNPSRSSATTDGLHVSDDPGLTTGGSVLGTVSFMSPEQARGEAIGTASDLYSLGIVLLELLGATPYRPGTASERLQETIEGRVQIEGLGDAALETWLRELTAAAPEDRPTAQAALERLQTLVDRPRKRQRRLRQAFIAAVAVIVLVAIGLAYQARARDAAETALAEELGEEVELVRQELRHAFTAPLHDISVERNATRARVKALHEKHQRSDGTLPRAAAAAIGESHLAIGDYDLAVPLLLDAWNRGYRGQRLAYHLGLALAAKYEAGRKEALGVPPGRIRDERLAEAEARWGAPLKEVLEEASFSERDAPELVEALVAALEQDEEAALAHLERLTKRQPWMYEAHRLAAELHSRRGVVASETEGYEGTFRHLDAAERELETALRAAQSDPHTRADLCRLSATRMGMAAQGADVTMMEEILRVGEERCVQARIVDPEALVLSNHGALYTRMGELLLFTGRESVPTIRKGLALIEQGLEEHESAAAWDQLGIGLDLVAYDEALRGRDPSPLLDRALHAFARALELDPGHVESYPHSLYALSVLLLYEIEHGGDARPLVARAREVFESGVAIDPAIPHLMNNFGNILLNALSYELWIDGNVEEVFEEAKGVLERGIELTPGSSFLHGNLGNVQVLLLDYYLEKGRDPSELLPKMREATRTALEMRAQIGWAHVDLGKASAFEAVWTAQHGGDPETLFRDAEEHMRRGLEVKGDDAWAWRQFTRLALLEGQVALDRGVDAREHLREAIRRSERALEYGKQDAEAMLRRGEAFVLLAEASGSGQQALRTEAREWIERALEANSNLDRLGRYLLTRLGG